MFDILSESLSLKIASPPTSPSFSSLFHFSKGKKEGENQFWSLVPKLLWIIITLVLPQKIKSIYKVCMELKSCRSFLKFYILKSSKDLKMPLRGCILTKQEKKLKRADIRNCFKAQGTFEQCKKFVSDKTDIIWLLLSLKQWPDHGKALQPLCYLEQ